jgi:methylmalonyl-CoA mutase C-terminal domain/subunit
MAEHRTRVLLGKIGLDGHDRGIRMIATWLSKAGMEVVYLGTHQTAERMARAAVEEDVDVIGLSFQGADHIPLIRMMAEEIKANGLEDRLLVVGGNIPRRDILVLKELGVDEVFPSASQMSKCVDYVRENARKRRK